MKPRITLTNKVDAKGRVYPDESWRGKWRCCNGFHLGYGATPTNAHAAMLEDARHWFPHCGEGPRQRPILARARAF